MKKYKLLRDLPNYPKGTIFEYSEPDKRFCLIEMCYLFGSIPENHTEWLELVEEGWQPEVGERYYFVLENYAGLLTTFTKENYGELIDRSRYLHKNCFETEQQAEEALKRVKETLRKYHEEIEE